MIIKQSIPFKYILSEIKYQLLIVLIMGTLADSLPMIVSEEYLPDIPITIATTLGIAISILLSFRISQSYERWWEARKIWGAIVNDSRTLVLQFQMYSNLENPLIQKMAYRQIAWCYALGQSLRKQNPLKDLSELLSVEELEEIEKHLNIPLKLLSIQMICIKELYEQGKLDRFARLQIEETIERLTASMGKCERIKNTVFPTTYRIGLHGAIYLFVIILSMSALKLYILIEVSLLLLISMVFFFLEKTAYRLQDPFENNPTDTPVTAIAQTIEINIRQLLDETVVPSSMQSKAYYIL